MPTRLLLEGDNLETLLAQVRDEHGSAATIVSAERVRSGGVAGFFAKQKYELTVELADDQQPGTAVAGSAGKAAGKAAANGAGTAGSTGKAGTAGSTGKAGTAGSTGKAGTAGSTGKAGTAGSTGKAGTAGMAGVPGAAGDSARPGAAPFIASIEDLAALADTADGLGDPLVSKAGQPTSFASVLAGASPEATPAVPTDPALETTAPAGDRAAGPLAGDGAAGPAAPTSLFASTLAEFPGLADPRDETDGAKADASRPEPTTPQATTPQAATPQAITPQAATPQAATSQAATPRAIAAGPTRRTETEATNHGPASNSRGGQHARPGPGLTGAPNAGPGVGPPAPPNGASPGTGTGTGTEPDASAAPTVRPIRSRNAAPAAQWLSALQDAAERVNHRAGLADGGDGDRAADPSPIEQAAQTGTAPQFQTAPEAEMPPQVQTTPEAETAEIPAVDRTDAVPPDSPANGEPARAQQSTVAAPAPGTFSTQALAGTPASGKPRPRPRIVNPVDPGPASAGPAIPAPGAGELAYRLIGLGVPEYLAATVTSADTYAAVVDIMSRLPVAPKPPTAPGTTLVVVGELGHALSIARGIAIGLRVDPARVVVAATPTAAAAAGVPAERQLGAAVDAPRWAAWLSGSEVPNLAVVDTGADADELVRARSIVDGLAPTAVWVAVDATRKTADLARQLAVLGQVDALAAYGTAATGDPASALALGVPVALVDGRPATPHAWAALLCERLQQEV